MERPRPNIISFIGKQLKYKTLPPDVLADVCLIGYSTSEIVNTRNIVIDAFEENIDYTQPRTTTTTDLREDLLRIFYYLNRFPCAVGQERQYTEHIQNRALVARLDGMSQVVTSLYDMLKKPEESMPSRNLQPGQCTNATDTGDQEFERQNNPLVPLELPMNMQEPAEPLLDPEEEVRVNAPLPNQGQEGLRRSPIQLMVSTTTEDARISSVRVEMVERRHVPAIGTPVIQQPTNQAPAKPEPIVDAPAAPTPKVQDDSSNDPVEDDLSIVV